MKNVSIKDIRDIIDIIRDTTVSEILIVSLFLLPILLGIWAFFLNSLIALNNLNTIKLLIITIIFIVYIIGIIWIKKADTEKEKLRRARFHILNRISKRTPKIGSFEFIRKEINQDYSDEFLNTLIDNYPETFQKQGIKGGKLGLGIIEEEPDKT